jgi:hypothetical protein
MGQLWKRLKRSFRPLDMYETDEVIAQRREECRDFLTQLAASNKPWDKQISAAIGVALCSSVNYAQGEYHYPRCC